MKTILIPTDFSVGSTNAFAYAVRFFGKDNKYILMNAYEEPHSASASMISLRDVLLEGSEDSLAEEKEWLKEMLGDDMPEIETMSKYGDSVTAITQTAGRHDVNIIVMGTTGATGFKGLFMGSVAYGVMRDSPCSVLAIPSGFQWREPKLILFTANIARAPKPGQIEMLREIGTNKELRIIAIGEEEEPKKEEMVQDLDALNCDFVGIKADNVEAAITSYANEVDADIIITIPRKNGWLHRLVSPSLSKKLAEHQHRPVLGLR